MNAHQALTQIRWILYPSTKLGMHISYPQPGIIEAYETLNPPLVKVLDFSQDLLKRFRCPVIGRLFFANQDLSADPVQIAHRCLSQDPGGYVTAWESYNEVLPESAPDSAHRRYNEFQVKFLEAMRREGKEAVAFNFGTGNGNRSLLERCYSESLKRFTYFGVHEYDFPDMWRLKSWLCLRYRRMFTPDQTVVVTECGITQGVVGGLDVGWRYPTNTTLLDTEIPITRQRLGQSLRWYDGELKKDANVLGACVFTYGSNDSRWDSFEMLC